MKQEYLFGQGKQLWDRIQRQAASCRRIILLLDYDGTLVPIRKTPSLAVLSPTMRTLLRSLSTRPTVRLGMVTGRSLPDINKLVRLKSIFYIANHGFEIFFNKKKRIHPYAARLRRLLQKVYGKLKSDLDTISSVLVENKQFTLTVHYRNVSSKMAPRVPQIVLDTVRPHRTMLRTTRGKKVMEVRPNVAWDKGHAVLHVLKLLRASPKDFIIYVGDDVTDEDAFKLLRPKAVTIRVGQKRTSRAKYFVRNPAEVQALLEKINSMSN